MSEPYAVRGRGVDTLWIGFDAIGMPTSRQPIAMGDVRAIIAANKVRDFWWYKTDLTDEICARWPHQPLGERGRVHGSNVLWIAPNRITLHEAMIFPLTVTARTRHGAPMHHFPGCSPVNAGARLASAGPAVTYCQQCFNPHDPDVRCEDI